MSLRLALGLLAALLAGLAVIYGTGLSYPPIFDDSLLVDAYFAAYAGWPGLRVRALSYGSFAWLAALAGEAIWPQRLLNVALHAATCVVLFRLHRLLAAHVQWPASVAQRAGSDGSRDLAVAIGVAVFAFNPMAVYAVAYLIQRSILMATLFAVLALWCVARGALERRWGWYAAALACYLAAVASKEHAVLLPAAALAVHVFLARPPLRRVVTVALLAALPLIGAAITLRLLRPELAGGGLDELSRSLVAQLESLAPGTGDRIWPLSIVNQAALFFQYGLLWFLPNTQWMSLDLRPAFPLTLAGWPQFAGALGYSALLAGAAAALLRSRGPLGYAALCLLLATLLFGTEFALVWVQDPFVLYRSYLWAIAIPGLVALVLVGTPHRILFALGVALSALLIALAIERVLTFKSEFTAWSDAAEKIDLGAPAAAVGRWRPFLNRGAYYLQNDLPEPALRDLQRAAELGEPSGAARFNAGVAFLRLKRPDEALAAIDAAIALGFDAPTRPLHRGDALAASGRAREAIPEFNIAIERADDEPSRRVARLKRAEAALGAREYALAADDFALLLRESPQDARLQFGLAMARLGSGDAAGAVALFDALLARRPQAAAHYGRALALRELGRRADALSDVERALGLEPGNPRYEALRAQLQTPGARR